MTNQVSKEMLTQEFSSAFHRVWETHVGLPLWKIVDEEHIHAPDIWVAGVVWIGGEWTGSTTIAISESLAQLVTSKMLGCDPNIVTVEQYKDAIRELTNMVAGNLKSSLPGPCGLATPGCFKIDDLAVLDHEFTGVIHLRFTCEGTLVIADLRSLF